MRLRQTLPSAYRFGLNLIVPPPVVSRCTRGGMEGYSGGQKMSKTKMPAAGTHHVEQGSILRRSRQLTVEQGSIVGRSRDPSRGAGIHFKTQQAAHCGAGIHCGAQQGSIVEQGSTLGSSRDLFMVGCVRDTSWDACGSDTLGLDGRVWGGSPYVDGCL